MAINTVTNRVEYVGTGSGAVFNFPYPFRNTTDLGVFIYNSTGLQPSYITPKVLNTHYQISSSAQVSFGYYRNGADIIFNSSPSAHDVIVIFRSSIVTSDYAAPFNLGNARSLDDEFMYRTLVDQRLQDQVTRAIRIPDGMSASSFDPTLPQNLRQSSGKRLIVNSSATGWTFDETLGSYIPNTLVYAQTNSTITSLGGAGVGLVLQSNGSSAPFWSAIAIGSGAVAAGSITGILAVTNGGTGTGEAFNYGNLVVAGSGGTYVQSHVLSFNSSASTFIIGSTTAQGSLQLIGFGAAPLRTSATGLLTSGSTSLTADVSGILPTTSGGTGRGGTYDAPGIIYASSTNQFSTIPSATAGYLLTANGSSAPSFQAFSATAISSGIISVGNGGTGTGTSYLQYGVFFASSATQFANTSPGGTDLPLVGNAGAAPSFRALNLASGSSVTGTLPFTQGGTGNTAFAQWQLVVASSTTQMSTINQGAPNAVLVAVASSAPAFQTLSTAIISSGILSVAQGGTGQVTASSAFNALAPGAVKGELLVRTGANVTPFPVGTDGQVIIADSSVVEGMRWGLSGSGSHILLQTQVAAGDSSIDFTTGINSSFSRYRLTVTGYRPGTNGSLLGVRFSNDGGGSFFTSGYRWSRFNSVQGGAINTAGSSGDLQITLNSTGNGAGEAVNYEFEIPDPASTLVRKVIDGQSYGFSAGVHFTGRASGAYTATSTFINAIRFLPSTGTMATGIFKLYGVL